MIASLHGTVKELQPQGIVMDVNGIGFMVHVPDSQEYKLQQIVELSISMHWSQENGPTLYGFSHGHDKIAFGLMISCHGIGPRLAMAVLKQMGSGVFFSAIMSGNIKALSSVSGLGAKKAEGLVLHLKEKVSDLMKELALDGVHQHGTYLHDVLQALQALQYTRQEITTVLGQLQKIDGWEKMSFDELMRRALALAKK